jgi:hypothetical protein
MNYYPRSWSSITQTLANKHTHHLLRYIKSGSIETTDLNPKARYFSNLLMVLYTNPRLLKIPLQVIFWLAGFGVFILTIILYTQHFLTFDIR